MQDATVANTMNQRYGPQHPSTSPSTYIGLLIILQNIFKKFMCECLAGLREEFVISTGE